MVNFGIFAPQTNDLHDTTRSLREAVQDPILSEAWNSILASYKGLKFTSRAFPVPGKRASNYGRLLVQVFLSNLYFELLKLLHLNTVIVMDNSNPLLPFHYLLLECMIQIFRKKEMYEN